MKAYGNVKYEMTMNDNGNQWRNDGESNDGILIKCVNNINENSDNEARIIKIWNITWKIMDKIIET